MVGCAPTFTNCRSTPPARHVVLASVSECAGRPTLRDADRPPSLPPSSLRSSLSSPPPPLNRGTEGGSLPSLDPGGEVGSLPPGRGVHPRFVVTPLPLPVDRDPLPGPRGRPRLPLVAAVPPTAHQIRMRYPQVLLGGAGLCKGDFRASRRRDILVS